MIPHGACISSLIRFGVFELDREAGELRKNGRKLKLEGQPLLVLGFLLERAGHVVTREHLKQRLWPSDTFVDFEQGINSAIKRVRQALGDSAETPRFIETLPRRGYRFIYPVQGAPDSESQPVRRRGLRRITLLALFAVGAVAALIVKMNSPGVADPARPLQSTATRLAVLPLENLTGDAELEYLADGIHDELVTQLAQIRALKVISRASVLRYKHTRKPLLDIARELNVEVVLEGSVRRQGENWHVTTQLVSGRDDRHLWAQSYDRSPRELSTLPGEVARTVARQLNADLTPDEQARLTKTQPLDPALYKAYWSARYFENKWTTDALQKAVGFYQQALDVDPAYAPAWAGLAETYSYLASWARGEGASRASDLDNRNRARAAASRAAQLDPTLRSPLQLLGTMRFEEWDWEGGAREFEAASRLESPPRFDVIYLLNTGRFDEAVTMKRRDAALDPLNFSEQLVAGWTTFMAGRYDEAIVALTRAANLEPENHPSYFELAWCYTKKGMHTQAIANCDKSLALLQKRQPSAFVAQGCEWVYAAAGRRREALELSRRIEADPRDELRFARVAHVYDALGERKLALAYLQKAYDQKDPRLPWQWFLPMFSDQIKEDPRFQELIRRTGHPWARFPERRDLPLAHSAGSTGH